MVQPELVAHHYTEAGLRAQALPYWQRAGQQARERSAHAEAIAHLTRGLELLTTLPETPERARQELSLHIALGATLAATKGYGNTEVERVYSRARELCHQLGDTLQLFPVQWGLWTCYIVQARQQLAREVGTQLLSLSQQVQNATFHLEAHMALAGSLHDLGEFTPARNHWDHSLACYDRQQHRSHILHFGLDLGVFSRAVMSHTLWHQGYPDQALTRSHEAFAAVAATAERRWEAELYRLKGELLLQAQSRTRQAEETSEVCFRQALGVARQQQAKSLELRAAMSLSRLWQQQGKPDAARQLLSEVYAWFSEGLDTVDLQEAKTLLEQLA